MVVSQPKHLRRLPFPEAFSGEKLPLKLPLQVPARSDALVRDEIRSEGSLPSSPISWWCSPFQRPLRFLKRSTDVPPSYEVRSRSLAACPLGGI